MYQLDMAEQGVDYLTLRQAEKAADVYERPLAALFLPEPPREPPQEAQFRRLPGAPAPPWPAEMQLLARRVRRRQDAAAELYEDLEEAPPWRNAASSFSRADRATLPQTARELLGVTQAEQLAWAVDDEYAPLRGWIDAVEALGVLVMQDGSMPLDTMRGFASLDDTVPAIIVNNVDDPRARAFTVLHELGHLVFAATDGPRNETRANDFAGEVVMPTDWLEQELRAAGGESLLSRVNAVARRFGVTPLAAAVRIRRAGLAPRGEAEGAIAAIRARSKPEERRGAGQYYYNTISKLGPSFIRLVLSALDSQTVTYPTASTLLGNVKVNHFETLRDYVARRGDVR
jgi:Zn-dependent peptidase ImmA (M78 family)